jgi:hypothetical protein
VHVLQRRHVYTGTRQLSTGNHRPNSGPPGAQVHAPCVACALASACMPCAASVLPQRRRRVPAQALPRMTRSPSPASAGAKPSGRKTSLARRRRRGGTIGGPRPVCLGASVPCHTRAPTARCRSVGRCVRVRCSAARVRRRAACAHRAASHPSTTRPARCRAAPRSRGVHPVPVRRFRAPWRPRTRPHRLPWARPSRVSFRHVGLARRRGRSSPRRSPRASSSARHCCRHSRRAVCAARSSASEGL